MPIRGDGRLSVKVGDLVKLKHRGNGHPKMGVIVGSFQGGLDREEYKVLWDCPEWAMGMWKERELVVISEAG